MKLPRFSYAMPLLVALLTAYVLAGSSPAMASSSFGFKSFSVAITNENGTPDTQAGSHPYAETYTFELNNAPNAQGIPELAGGKEVKDLAVNLPPGVIGDATAAPQCPRRLFDATGCPSSTQVGEDTVGLAGTQPGPLILLPFPVYNIVPPPGVPAELGFNFEGIHGIIDIAVRPGSEQYGLTAHVYNITQRAVASNSVTIWGVPSHHGAAGAEPRAFLTLPASCSDPLKFSISATTWQEPNAAPAKDSTETPPMAGCDRFTRVDPSIAVAPDTSHAETPAGLTAEVTLPEDPGLTSATEGRTVSDIQNTTVTLPAGVVINPGQATGLAACQPLQEALQEPQSPPSCPAASKVGTVSVSTPLLPDKLEGDVYVLQSDPPHLQLLVAPSGDGVNLKLIGDVHLDPVSGQLTTTFSGTPQFPFTDFKLSFSGGAQAALVTPLTCGVYTTAADFTPWSSPFTPDTFPGSAFVIDAGADGSPACPSSPLPFAPSMIAGATTDQAGGFTDFSLLLQRGDGQQPIERMQFRTPQGLEGMISGVPLCPEPQASLGDCSAVSQIGHTVVEAGPGPYPLVVPQPGEPPAPIYLTGPYEGAPFGLSIVTPVIAGPFNLGTIVTRASISVDPHTAQITVTTDPLPRIVDGIPTDLRTIDAVIDRPGFMLNPTNCNAMSFSGTASSTQGASAPLSSPFQVGSCRGLEFAPKFSVSTSAQSTKANGESLTTKLAEPPGSLGTQSNITRVKVDLPIQLPSRLTTLQKACLAKVFESNPAACPPQSIVGHAKVITPLLPVPLQGPAYFVSHGGEAFPSLIVVLQGYGVTVDLVGTTFINKKGITSTTFETVPDTPFNTFELTLPKGKFSALGANIPEKAKGDFCGQNLKMPTEFLAQNGAVIHQSTPITITGCPKAKVKKKAKKANKAKRARTSTAVRRHHEQGRSA
jgi:hypothetical protein